MFLPALPASRLSLDTSVSRYDITSCHNSRTLTGLVTGIDIQARIDRVDYFGRETRCAVEVRLRMSTPSLGRVIVGHVVLLKVWIGLV